MRRGSRAAWEWTRATDSASCHDAFGYPQLGAAGARVESDLVVARDDRLARQRLERAALSAKEVLDDAILERVKRDHRQPPARGEDRRGSQQPLTQRLQLVV